MIDSQDDGPSMGEEAQMEFYDEQVYPRYGYTGVRWGNPQYSMMNGRFKGSQPNSMFDELPWQIEDDLALYKPEVNLEAALIHRQVFGPAMTGKSQSIPEVSREIYNRRNNMPKYEEVTRYHMNLEPNENYKIELVKNPGSKTGFITVKREVKERDITSQCTVKLVKSSTVDRGYYIKLLYRGHEIAIVGVWDSHDDHVITKGYRIERPNDAWYSFRVIKTC